jgi:hypothetical protein
MDLPAADAPLAEWLFTFATTRDAIEGEKKLIAGDMSPAVMPLPDQLGAGCGICLRVGTAELEKARAALGPHFQNIYIITAASGAKVFTLWNP